MGLAADGPLSLVTMGGGEARPLHQVDRQTAVAVYR